MEIRVLRYFLAVAEEGNVTRAAETQHVTQPTLSRQLAELERELGCTLFERTSKGVALTREGRLLRQRAEEMVMLADRTARELSASADDVAGDLYLGMGETRAVEIVADAVREMRRRHPHVHVHLRSGNADYVIERVEAGVFDIGLLIGHGTPEGCDMAFLPHQDRFALLVPSGDPLAKRQSISSAELSGMPLLIPVQRNHGNGTWQTGYLPNACDLDIVGTYNLVYNAILMVSRGCGYALTQEGLREPIEEDVICVPISDAVPMRTIAVWKHQTLLPRPLSVFLDALHERCRE